MVKKIKIGFLGSRPLAEKILTWVANRKEVVISGVVAPEPEKLPNDNLKKTAQKLKLNVMSFAELFNQNPDIVFSINYWKKITLPYLNQPPLGIINIHHSYNLRLRGRYSTSFAILRARKDNFWKHGTTLHYIEEEIDRGPIIDCESCEILEEDTAETLFNKVENLALGLFAEKFTDIISGDVKTYPPADESFYYAKSDAENKEINLSWSAEEIYDFVRAWTFSGKPKPYIQYKNYKIFLTLENLKTNE